MSEQSNTTAEVHPEPESSEQLSGGGWYLLLSFVLPTIFILLVGWLI